MLLFLAPTDRVVLTRALSSGPRLARACFSSLYLQRVRHEQMFLTAAGSNSASTEPYVKRKNTQGFSWAETQKSSDPRLVPSPCQSRNVDGPAATPWYCRASSITLNQRAPRVVHLEALREPQCHSGPWSHARESPLHGRPCLLTRTALSRPATTYQACHAEAPWRTSGVGFKSTAHLPGREKRPRSAPKCNPWGPT